jgi:hypothetical protein
MIARKRETLCLRVDRRCSLGLMIVMVATYSSELSLSFGAVVLATGLMTVMDERMQAIQRDLAVIQKRTAEIELASFTLFGGEEDDSAQSQWVGDRIVNFMMDV